MNWFDLSNTLKYQLANKIIIKECIIFYNKQWKTRNKILYSTEVQHDYLIKWYKKTKSHREGIGREALKFIEKYEIDESRDSNRMIKE